MPYLLVTSEDKRVHRADFKGAVVLGRATDCDLWLADLALSRRHCRIEPREGGWVVVDLNSRNGTYVGDEPIEERPLQDGDVIRLGSTKAVFRIDRPAVPRPADPAVARVERQQTEQRTLVAPPKAPRPLPVPRPKPPSEASAPPPMTDLELLAAALPAAAPARNSRGRAPHAPWVTTLRHTMAGGWRILRVASPQRRRAA